jgi:diguanylate cyclase (GGDEF)-like protein
LQWSLRTGLSVGFALVLLLMLGLTVVALMRMAAINAQVDRIAKINNVKTELAHEMKNALRDRAIIMHSISLLTDPFEQNEEFLRLNEQGGDFVNARNKLMALPLGSQEQEILARLRQITVKTQPVLMEAVGRAMRGQQAEARELIAGEAVSLQRRAAGEISKLIKFQEQETQRAVDEAASAYRNTRFLMLILAGSATVIGMIIAVVVVRHTNKQARALQHQAMFDGLTNLPNRALFSDRLQQAIFIGRREQQPFALIALDLNRFKEINDTLGHHAGDAVLKQVAERLRGTLRESDTVARMGGDEFNILLPTVGHRDGACTVAAKIVGVLLPPMHVSGQQLEIAGSLGIALFPLHGEKADSLMRHADAAMYTAKRTQNHFKVYDAEVDQQADDRVALRNDLRRAISGDELVLHYQPKIDMESNCVTGAEALVRWQHPKHGLLYPDKFIALAEESGLIKGLTNAVLTTALAQCERWRKEGRDLSMAINISAVNIQDPEFPDEVAALLKQFDVPPSSIELEVTETAVMTEPERAVACIKKLSALGLQIAIDDFGTGYSSMSYLKELLVAKIKIDRSFVKDMAVNHNDAVIVRSTVELGHNLGMKVIAEGVESEKVWERLKALGCDSAQGYYMSHPIPADEFVDWLERSEWSTSA